MKIACIGWGSLIWNPEDLKICNKWFQDGPILPIEFTRQSEDGRITLIIDSIANPVRTLWALMTTDDLKDAIESLKEREKTVSKNIHHVHKSDSPVDPITITIKNWILSKDLDAAIWTGLSHKKGEVRPTISQVINQLLSLNYITGKAAEEYVRRAPKQIDTEYRRAIEKNFGWTAID